MHMLDMDAILGPNKARGGDDVDDSDSVAEEVGRNKVHDRSSLSMWFVWRCPASKVFWRELAPQAAGHMLGLLKQSAVDAPVFVWRCTISCCFRVIHRVHSAPDTAASCSVHQWGNGA